MISSILSISHIWYS